MPRIFGLSIRTRERVSRWTANCPPISGIWFENCREQAVRARESGIRLVIETRIAPDAANSSAFIDLLVSHTYDSAPMIGQTIAHYRIDKKLRGGGKAPTSPCESHKLGFISYQFDVRLARGRAGMRSVKAAEARAGLGALEKDAASKGFLLIARQAHTTSAPR
jgi:hypothetical protein